MCFNRQRATFTHPTLEVKRLSDGNVWAEVVLHLVSLHVHLRSLPFIKENLGGRRIFK